MTHWRCLRVHWLGRLTLLASGFSNLTHYSKMVSFKGCHLISQLCKKLKKTSWRLKLNRISEHFQRQLLKHSYSSNQGFWWISRWTWPSTRDTHKICYRTRNSHHLESTNSHKCSMMSSVAPPDISLNRGRLRGRSNYCSWSKLHSQTRTAVS